MAQKVLTLSAGGIVTEITDASVSAVTGTDPVVSSGGATPAISMAKSTAAVDGYLAAADFTTFAAKATDSLVVHLAGTESITGDKTFSGTTAFPSGSWGTGGNVGIGVATASATARLDVRGANCLVRATSTTGTNSVRYAAFNTGGSIYMGIDDSAAGEFGTSNYGRFIFCDGAYSFHICTNSVKRLSIDSSGNATFSANVGFNGTTPIAKPTITGSRAGNAALASLLTALANYGLITDSTTA